MGGSLYQLLLLVTIVLGSNLTIFITAETEDTETTVRQVSIIIAICLNETVSFISSRVFNSCWFITDLFALT